MFSEKIHKEKQDHKIHETQDWIDALKLSLLIFIILLYYYYLRMGIFLPFFIDNNINFIYLSNKIFALTAVTMISISVLIGPLASFFPYFGKKIGVRKEIGIVGFLLGLIHIIISFLYSLWGFTWAFLAANLATILLIIVTIFSNKKSLLYFGYKKWKAIQRLVWLALIFIVFHILALGQFVVWKNWLSNPAITYYLPPTNLVIIIFVMLSFSLRFIVFIKDRLK